MIAASTVWFLFCGLNWIYPVDRSPWNILQSLSVLSAPIHQACLKAAPESRYRPNYQSMICAAHSLPHGASDVGIYHLLIFSGAHLLILEHAFQVLIRRHPRFAKVATVFFVFNLFSFLLMSGFELRILRALLAFAFTRASRFFQLRWTRVQILTAAGVICASICSQAADLNSLLLSWIASLAFSGFGHEMRLSANRSIERLSLHARIYFFLIPALLPFSLPHPLSVICGFLLSAVLSLSLLPMCLSAYAFPQLHLLGDAIWNTVELLIDFFSNIVPTAYPAQPIPVVWLLLYISALTLLAWRAESKTV